ncbi:MAG TPA: HAD hydrolase-like protein [Candidatus Omnitrophota bacterium]|nr:HAD hydrolase-like protein [Candidatus Omnitrophota bacterium]
MKIKAILFDIDGVLVDVRQSYIETIRKTVELYLGKQLRIPGRGRRLLSKDDVNRFKLLGGFNNDWDAVYGILLYLLWLRGKAAGGEMSFGKLARLKNFEALRRKVPSPCGIRGLERLTGKNRNICYKTAKDMFQELYLGKKLFRKRYRKNPRFTQKRGLIEKETLLVSPAILSALRENKIRFGIVTGRTRFEAEYALRRFGILKYFDALVTHDEIEAAEKKLRRPLRKPHPYPVLACAKKIKASAFFYVGDLPDDIKAANGAKKKIRIASCAFLWRQDNPVVMKKALRAAQPDFFINRPSDLLRLAAR